jgi:hypothetical protein
MKNKPNKTKDMSSKKAAGIAKTTFNRSRVIQSGKLKEKLKRVKNWKEWE